MRRAHERRGIRRVVVLLAVLLLAAGTVSAAPTEVPAVPPPVEVDGPEATRYIVGLEDPPLAQYRGGVDGLAPTAVDIVGGIGRGGVHLDYRSPAARAYVAYLDRQQARVLQAVRAIAPDTRVDWRYHYTFNGLALTLTADEARRVEALPGVVVVHIEEHLEPDMDQSLELIGAPPAWEQVGGPEEAGAGARVAMIDTGLDADHPFFDDEGMAAPEGYPVATMHLRDGTVLDYPAPEDYTNDKVIAARIFASPAAVASCTSDDRDLLATCTPYGGGHGNHTAGTATGRYDTYDVDLRPFLIQNTKALTLSGVAPQAYVLNYKANYSGSPEYIAMLDQMVEDEVDAFNMSLGNVSWLLDQVETHPMAMAYDAAADAGIVSVFSAGNAGANGLTSLSGTFKYHPRVLAVGNATSTVSSFQLQLGLDGEDPPAEQLPVGPRGNIPISETITAPLLYVPNGGCEGSDEMAGTIVVIERFDETTTPIGPCGYTDRAEVAAQHDARAIVYVYYDRELGNASGTALALPGVAIGTRDGPALLEWLQAHPEGATGSLMPDAERIEEAPDVLSGSSSRGPGVDWRIKPDITAPGSSILSSYTAEIVDGEGAVPHFRQLSGTSMAAPHVAGAAGLVRSAHPSWTSDQVRSALVNSTVRTVQVRAGGELRPAHPYEGGPGRLHLEHALSPGALLAPTTASFGELIGGETGRLVVSVESVSDTAETWTVDVERLVGGAEVEVEPTALTLEPGATAELVLTLDTTELTADEHYGDIVLHRGGLDDDDERRLRLAYYAYVDAPAARKDVLLVNWTFGETEDYSTYYTEALDALDVSYDVWHAGEPGDGDDAVRAHPPFKTLQRYDLVIFNANMSTYAIRDTGALGFSGAYQYQNYLVHGGNMLWAGQGTQDWWTFRSHQSSQRPLFSSFSQNGGCDICVPRYFAGFTPGLTATLSGELIEFPAPPDEPEVEVVLEPHDEADGPFDYSVDISTGSLAKDDAAGNQYWFSSGDLLAGKQPQDPDNTTVVIDRVSAYARPLWQYDDRVVGTYIAGKRERGSGIGWNAMFWGFGLEGVGQAGDETASRTQLLGDAIAFLTVDVPRWPELGLETSTVARDVELELTVVAGPMEREVEAVAVDWGDDVTTVISESVAMPLGSLSPITHTYDADGMYALTVTVTPACTLEAEAACPADVVLEAMVEVYRPTIHLPALYRAHELMPTEAP